MFYVIAPQCTNVSAESALRFADAVVAAISDYEDCILLSTETQLDRAVWNIGADDGVCVFVSESSDRVSDLAESVLHRARLAEAIVVPVVVERGPVHMPPVIDDLDRFCAYEWLRDRQLPATGMPAIARLYAWSVLGHLKPTFANHRLQIFVSYARANEQLARHVGEALRGLGIDAVRDTLDLRGGRQIRPAIEERMEDCDAVVLLDDEAAVNSEWVDWELMTAKCRGIPTVWVDCGAPSRNPSENFVLGGTPDLSLTTYEGDVDALASDVADTIRHKLVQPVRDVCAFLSGLEEMHDGAGCAIERIDPRRGIYEVRYRESLGVYPVRPRRHVVQVFARRPRHADHDRLVQWLESREYFSSGSGPPADRRLFDAAVMVTATSRGGLVPSDGFSVAESHLRYLASLGEAAARARPVGEPPSLLIFGAFPTGSITTQQIETAARLVTGFWLSRGGAVSFGGHPTITVQVVSAGREAVGEEKAQQRVRLYQSAFWPSQPRISDLLGAVEVVRVNAVAGDRDASLDTMRRRMIDEAEAAAAIAIGGRTSEDGNHSPGVRIEVKMAVDSGVPVFLLGATGGETAHLYDELVPTASGFMDLTALPADQLVFGDYTDDYHGAASRIWNLVAG